LILKKQESLSASTFEEVNSEDAISRLAFLMAMTSRRIEKTPTVRIVYDSNLSRRQA